MTTTPYRWWRDPKHPFFRPPKWRSLHPGNGIRLEDRYIPEPNSGCWLWIGSIAKNGYGRLGRGIFAHRVFYERAVGRIPRGFEVDHTCSVRSCVNPAHLQAVNRIANVALAVERRRRAGRRSRLP